MLFLNTNVRENNFVRFQHFSFAGMPKRVGDKNSLFPFSPHASKVHRLRYKLNEKRVFRDRYQVRHLRKSAFTKKNISTEEIEHLSDILPL